MCKHALTDVFRCFQPAYNYSVENQTLTEALDKQQNGVHHIYSSIAELLVDHPMKSHTPPETEEQGL